MPQHLKLQGLIFDLDGTLLDSAPDLSRAVNQTLQAFGRKAVAIEEVKKMVGDGMVPLLKRAFAATGQPLNDTVMVNKVAQSFLDNYNNLPPDQGQIYPHVREQLEYFQKAGVKLGLCTNKQESATLLLMRELDMTRHFICIAGYDTFPTHKPHPGHVLGVMHKMNVAAGQCVMVGDSANDIVAAHGAGIPCIAVSHGYGNDVGGLGADYVMASFDQLPTALKALGFDLV